MFLKIKFVIDHDDRRVFFDKLFHIREKYHDIISRLNRSYKNVM